MASLCAYCYSKKHTSFWHFCSECRIRGHDIKECKGDEYKYPYRSSFSIPLNSWCKYETCEYPETHITNEHLCVECNKHHYKGRCNYKRIKVIHDLD